MSILNAEYSQITLSDDGQVFYQKQAGNPLPGEAVARLERGGNILKPKVVALDASVEGLDAKLAEWLDTHLKTVLEPLVALENDEAESSDAVKGIAHQVHEAMGILPRENLEDLIAQLDTDTRRDLRGKKIRLGPILVFIPALNKPAAVRLRAQLWGLFHGKDLPMDVPKDGIVSFEIDPAAVDKDFYQSIGYPVFGKRAIRIDMLDRVISAVYDSADKGQFKAQHTMAEWLGSSIEGLYDVLEAMGHKKVFDPAEQEQEEENSDGESDAVKAEGEKAEDVKPELATFRLKKGKAFQNSKPASQKKDKPEKKQKGKRNKSTNRAPKIMSAEAKVVADSPFAVLEQLKKQSDG